MRKKADKVKDPLAWVSTRFTNAHTLHWTERAAIYIPEIDMTWGEACGALKKCWTGYRIAVNKGEYENIQTYAGRINNIQKHMGIPVTWFEELDPDGDVI